MNDSVRRIRVLNDLLQAGVHLDAAARQLVHVGDKERALDLSRQVRDFRYQLQRRQLPGGQLL